jgi:glycosyltransferase involved in cell wall biosynthesis
VSHVRIAVYHNLTSGGAKRTLLEGVRRLSRDHRVDAFSLSCAEQEFADLRPWVANHTIEDFAPLPLLRSPFGRLNQALRSADLLRLDRCNRRVAQRIDAGGYDVVFAHPCRFEQSPGVLRYLRTRSVYYCQEPLRLVYEVMPRRPYDGDEAWVRRVLGSVDPLPGMYRRMVRGRDRANAGHATAVLVNSRFMADAVGRIYGVPARVSYHGVDTAQFRPISLDKRRFVLSVGSLTPLKGFDFLVRALARYPADQRPMLVIASNFQNPPERAYLESLAGALGVQLVLTCAVSDEALVRLYNEALLVAYAPVREPFGLVPLEAMACGTPVVAVAEGGIPESVRHEETGLLTSRDPDQFALAIQALIDDPARAREYGARGREHVLAQWTWDAAVRSLESELVSATQMEAPARAAVPALVR